jgi:hypothetical protein
MWGNAEAQKFANNMMCCYLKNICRTFLPRAHNTIALMTGIKLLLIPKNKSIRWCVSSCGSEFVLLFCLALKEHSETDTGQSKKFKLIFLLYIPQTCKNCAQNGKCLKCYSMKCIFHKIKLDKPQLSLCFNCLMVTLEVELKQISWLSAYLNSKLLSGYDFKAKRIIN